MTSSNKKYLLTVIKITACTVAVFLIFLFLLDQITKGAIDQFYSQILFLYHSGRLRSSVKAFIIIGGILLIVLTFFSAGYLAKYMKEKQIQKETQILLDNFDVALSQSNTLMTFPDKYKELENRLNAFTNATIRNEQIAKESEQRKNDLVVYLAHDLKTPLTSVIGYLSLLHEEQGISPELRQKYLSISLDKAERLEELINEFFDITRFNLQHITLDKTAVDIPMLLHQLADEFYPVFSSKGLTCTVTANPCTILADADKLARVFDNLLKNAIAYSFPDTNITVKASTTDRQMQVCFRNFGRQIPEHKLISIFEKFYRLDSSRSSQTGGSGLGLAIAKEIAELHQGTISVTSDEKYTEFQVCIPLLSA